MMMINNNQLEILLARLSRQSDLLALKLGQLLSLTDQPTEASFGHRSSLQAVKVRVGFCMGCNMIIRRPK